MFSAMKVLVVESDSRICNALASSISALSFDVRSAATLGEAIKILQTDQPDILFANETLVNGSASILLSEWVRNRGGPCAMYLSPEHYAEDSCSLLGKGCWNVLRLDVGRNQMIDLQTLNALLVRYAQVVESYRVVELYTELNLTLRKKLRKVWGVVITLAILSAAYAGPDIIGQLVKLIGGIL